MAYRGYLALNDVEISNSARVIAHLGGVTPTEDFGFFGGDDGSYTLIAAQPGLYEAKEPPMGEYDPMWGWAVGTLKESPESPGLYLTEWEPCMPIESFDYPGLGLLDESQHEVTEGLGTPMTGSRIFGPGLFIHDQCWGSPTICHECRSHVGYDDSWPGLQEWLGDITYRPELAPWYSTEIPESGEFGGIWITDMTGFDATPIERAITEASGDGGIAGVFRNGSRKFTFTALLVACTNAGVEWGLKYLTNLLRETSTSTDYLLRYLTASPANSAADPDTLVREIHNVLLTKEPTVQQRMNISGKGHQHGSMYLISWEMGSLSPFAYLPGVQVDVQWDQISRQPINWIHAADCAKPETCTTMPVMFSTTCQPESIAISSTPPPVCGGCLPVSAIDKYSFQIPGMDYAFRGRETVMSLVITNTGPDPLSLQSFLRVCGADVRCEDNRFPLQIAGLPSGAILHLDGITGRFKAYYDELWRIPIGIVGTPNGAPWRPAIIDRETCFDFIVQSASTASFTVQMLLTDREP